MYIFADKKIYIFSLHNVPVTEKKHGAELISKLGLNFEQIPK